MAYAFVIKYFCVGVYTIRLLTAFCGVATTFIICLIGKEMFSRRIGLTASFIYAISPEVVYWSRIGFANNLYILLTALSLYFIYRYSKKPDEKMLYLGCFSAGFSILTEYSGMLNLLAIWIFLRIYHREKALKAAVLSLVPLALLFSFMLCQSPEYFIFDLKYQLERFLAPIKIVLGLLVGCAVFLFRKRIEDYYRPIGDMLLQESLICVAVISLASFYATEDGFWHATTFLFLMGFVGLCFTPSFLIGGVKERRLLVLFYLSSLLSILALDRADHMTMVIYPFISIGMAAMLFAVYRNSLLELPWILRRYRISLSKRMLFMVVFYPLLVLSCVSAYMFLYGSLSSESLEADHAVAEYINQYTSQNDLVLTYSWMFPMIRNAKVGLLTQSLAYEGISIAYYSGDFPKERFAFNTSYRNARFIVADGHVLDWILNETGSNETVRYLETWNKTPVAGFVVYANPGIPTQ
jgi:hypothetical protein